MVEATANIQQQPGQGETPDDKTPDVEVKKEYKDAVEESVEAMAINKIKQVMSPFINQ